MRASADYSERTAPNTSEIQITACICAPSGIEMRYSSAEGAEAFGGARPFYSAYKLSRLWGILFSYLHLRLCDIRLMVWVLFNFTLWTSTYVFFLGCY